MQMHLLIMKVGALQLYRRHKINIFIRRCRLGNMSNLTCHLFLFLASSFFLFFPPSKNSVDCVKDTMFTTF